MPCLNEEKTAGNCIAQAKSFLNTSKVTGEVIIADKGSMDQSVKIAEKGGTRVVHVENKGYGSALLRCFKALQGKYIIMADSDESYDLVNLLPFVEKLCDGYDLVM